MPELDAYEKEGIDNDDQHELNFQERREADRELNQQDHQRDLGRARQAAALIDGDDDDEEDMEGRLLRQQ